jgi:adenylate kinase
MIIVFIGPPGSGKGTQAKLLAKRLGLDYFSTGEMLRTIKKNDAQLAKIMDSGELIPDDKLVQYVMDYLKKNNIKDNFILDGSPRTLYQYERFKDEFDKFGKKMDILIYLHISDDEVVRRQSARRTDKTTGEIYNLLTNPPGPEVKEENLEQREDDKPEAIRNRIKVYHELTQPLVDELEKEGKVKMVDGERPIEEIYVDIEKIINNHG